MALEERKWRILQMIVDNYIVTATPVGSRVISKHPDIELSSATIRNEMSDLEELGYLVQPHTSSGRIPSDKAYRLYVDQMMKIEQLSDDDISSIRQLISERIDKASELVSQTAKVLSKLTRYPAVAILPDTDPTIRHIQLVPINEERALAIIVTDEETIHDMMMSIPDGFGTDELERYSRMLTACLAGSTLSESYNLLKDNVNREIYEHKSFFDQITNALDWNSKKRARTPISLGGTSNIFFHPEFNNLEHARNMLSILETDDLIYSLLEPRLHKMQVTITIGGENQIDEMKGTSIVTASYSFGHSNAGTFGIIGPTRMEYSRVVAILNYLGHSLSEILTDKLDE